MWKQIIANEQNKPYFTQLQSFLSHAYDTTQVFPKKEDIYNAFDLCPFKDVKVIILGQDPYHDVDQAHGLAFSVKKGQKIPPSLRNIFTELHADLGVDIPEHGDLTSWAKQGVLLLNTILTVEAHKPLSHKNIGWEIFTDHILQILNEDNRPKAFILWGNKAKEKALLITNNNHLVLTSSHPSPLSARHSFFGSSVFSKINAFLYDNNRKQIDFRIK